MKILFICTHNRCRSILCEAITNYLAKNRITAYSAGSQPAGQVHPLSIKYLKQCGISAEELQSQSWNDFHDIKPDLVITVCDNAANETCPAWIGESMKVHWGLPDPSKLEGSDEDIEAAFIAVIDTIEKRINALLQEDIEALSAYKLQSLIQALA